MTSIAKLCAISATALCSSVMVRPNAVLMSIRPNAPYADHLEDDGFTLIYEGHDLPRSAQNQNPKGVDQPEFTPTGQPTENGKFHMAAQDFKAGTRSPERVRVHLRTRFPCPGCGVHLRVRACEPP